MNRILILVIVCMSVAVFSTNYVFADSELPPVYQEPQLVLDKYRYTWGDTINVTVISPLNNTDPTIPDIIMTAPMDAHGSDTRHDTYLDNYSLVETGPDTGIFVGKFQIVKPGDKPSENSGIVDEYIEVSPDSDYVTVMLEKTLEDSASGLSVEFTYPSDPTPPDGFTNRTISAYPNAQFRWKESISPHEEIGTIRVAYPEQNISDKVDSFVAIVYGRIYTTLTETGKDTGIFETEIAVTTENSPTKITVKPNQWQSITVTYYINDQLQRERNDGFNLYNSLESQHLVQKDAIVPITIHTDSDWYLSNQQIGINGQAEPNEDLTIIVSGKKSTQEKFRHVIADSSGSFSTSVEWNESRFFSGEHVVQAIGSKHSEISKKDITIISLDELHSRAVDVSPKQQMEMGILPQDIVCHQVWNLVLKPNGKTAVCLEPPTASKLENRGWTILHKTHT